MPRTYVECLQIAKQQLVRARHAVSLEIVNQNTSKTVSVDLVFERRRIQRALEILESAQDESTLRPTGWSEPMAS